MDRSSFLPKYLRVWPEWESSGIWEINQPKQSAAGRMVGFELLNLPFDLQEQFKKWIEWFDDAQPGRPKRETFPWAAFNEAGYALARQLESFLGKDVYVEYYLPDVEDFTVVE